MKDQFGSVYNSRGCFQIEGICFEDFLSFELFGDKKKDRTVRKNLVSPSSVALIRRVRSIRPSSSSIENNPSGVLPDSIE